MAQNIAVTTTLGLMMARIRDTVGAVSEQDSGLLEADLIDVVHNAILGVRAALGPALEDFYKIPTTAISLTGTTPNFSASIATIDIASMEKRALFSSTLGGEIPIYDAQEFNQIRSLYTATQMGNSAVATIAQASGTYASQPTASTITIRVYSGYASAATDLEFTIIRSPRRVTTGTDTLDIPDAYADSVHDKAVELLKMRGK